MATPTPGHGHPGSNKNASLQAGAASGLTPSSLGSQQHLSAFSSPFSSQAGKSAPSPATAHASIAGLNVGAAAGKSAPSPANMSAYPSVGGKSALSPATHFGQRGHKHASSTPNAAALTFDSPSAAASLGLNLGAIGTPSGLGGLINARSDEEERARRIESILELLRTRPGRVSEEAVERLAKRTGLDCLWEEKTLSIAGSSVLVDLDFENHVVDRVSLSFPSSSDAVSAHAPRAAAILHTDLKPEKGTPSINTTLNKFADNLERLARLDKLSTPEVNCFEAIAGVYTSLRRIFEHEKKQTKQDVGIKEDADEAAERRVLCEKSGRPRMHAGKRVGLALEYWTDRRRVPSAQKPKAAESGPDDMDIDSSEKTGSSTNDATVGPDEDSGSEGIWSAIIECEASPAELYPSIRISNDWVSQRIERPSEEQDELFGPDGPSIDWIEPAPTFISGPGAQHPGGGPGPSAANTIGQDPMDTSSGQNISKLSDIRFVARLEPPVVVPLQKAVEIYDSVGLVIPQESIQPTTLDGLILPPDPSEASAAVQGEARYLSSSRRVLGFDQDGKECVHTHEYALFAHKLDFGRVVDEIPFRHPMELINILPILRQYALTTRLLKQTFEGAKGLDWSSSSSSTLALGVTPGAQPLASQTAPRQQNLSPEDELAALLDGDYSSLHPSALSNDKPAQDSSSLQPPLSFTTRVAPAGRSSSAYPVDVGLSMHPHPNFSLAFSIPIPLPSPLSSSASASASASASSPELEERLVYIHLSILPDAVVRASCVFGPSTAETTNPQLKQETKIETDNGKEESKEDQAEPEQKEPEQDSVKVLAADDEVARVCSVAEDFGIVVEYVRRKALQRFSRGV